MFLFIFLNVNNTCANGVVTHAGHVFKSFLDEMISINFLEVGIWLEWGGWGYVGMRFDFLGQEGIRVMDNV